MFFISIGIAIAAFLTGPEKSLRGKAMLLEMIKQFSFITIIMKRQVKSLRDPFKADLVLFFLHFSLLSIMIVFENVLGFTYQWALLEIAFNLSDFVPRAFPFTVSYKHSLIFAFGTYFAEVLISSFSSFTSVAVGLIVNGVIHVQLLAFIVFRYLNRHKPYILINEVGQCIHTHVNMQTLMHLPDAEQTQPNVANRNQQRIIFINGSMITLKNITVIHESEDAKPRIDTKPNNPQVILSLSPMTQGELITNQRVLSSITDIQKLPDLKQQDEIIDNTKVPQTSRSDNNNNNNDLQSNLPKSSIEADLQVPTPMASFQGINLNQMIGCNQNVLSNNSQLFFNNQTPTINTDRSQQRSMTSNLSSTINFPRRHKTITNAKANEHLLSLRQTICEELISIVNAEQQNEKIKSMEILSYHEGSNRLLVKMSGSVWFYSLPDLKKQKTVILDKASHYVFHRTEPLCVQYHYNTKSKAFMFVRLDLSKERISKADLKYQSVAVTYPSCPTNGFIYFSSFTVESNQRPVDKAFLRDGKDLIVICMKTLSVETHQNIATLSFNDQLKLEQINCRQVILYSKGSDQQRIIVDIPTSLHFKSFKNQDITVQVKQIEFLQNQVVLNSDRLHKNACVYDINTHEVMELQGTKGVIKAWYFEYHLFVIDSTNNLKVFSFAYSNFSLLPPSDLGIQNISIEVH